VSHCGLAIYLKANEELRKLHISPCKNIIFKKPSKRDQNPSRYYKLYNYSQVSTEAKISCLKNASYKNRPIPKATILYNESKHNILALVGKANKNRGVSLCGLAIYI